MLRTPGSPGEMKQDSVPGQSTIKKLSHTPAKFKVNRFSSCDVMTDRVVSKEELEIA